VLTVAQAAERLGVSPALVYNLVALRKLRYCRVGNGRGRLRIPEDAVSEYLSRVTFDVAPTNSQAAAPRPRLKNVRL
jgi:excisionase family DNA binding protein